MNKKLVSVILAFSILGFAGCSSKMATTTDKKETKASSAKGSSGKLDAETGLIIAKGFEETKANCVSCHSSAFITSNKGDKQKWKERIVWMQKTQGLWDLGENEPIILEYLATHYAPSKVYRRPPLKVEWKN